MSRQALRRIPLEKFVDLKVDFAFKQLFGSERNKEITVVFLNAILQRTGRESIAELVFMNQEVGGQYDGDKQSRLDIVVKTQSEELINIEMQLTNQHDMMKRTLYYWSKLFVSQMQKGKGYHILRPTIAVNICHFTQFPHTKQYHSTYHLCEDEQKQRLVPSDDVLEVHFIEMNKFIAAWHNKELDSFGDILVRWLLLLGMVDARKQKVYDEIYTELEELAMKDEKLIAAFEAWEELSQTPETIIAYQSRLKAIIDEEARIDSARHYGREEGRAEGKKEGKEEGRKEGKQEGKQEALEAVVKKLLSVGTDLETIQTVSGWTEAQINQIKQQKNND